MVFSSITFFIFFITILIILLIIKKQNQKKLVLLIASYFFYGYWDYRFLSLIFFSTCVDFFAGKKMYCTSENKARKRYLAISIITNLGLLSFFKYFNFFINSFNYAFGNLGINLSTLNIILPVGISFYTFQTMSYTIDIYRDKLQPADKFLDFALFVSFFPQLVAGPIVRATDFLPQLKNPINITKNNLHLGLQLLLLGLIKKVLIADRIAYFVDSIFSGPSLYNSTTIILAIIGYSIQIYCDFSGYSDMAIGVAKCLGFDLPENFRLPYLSKNVTEFWKRWHISLSSWLKDYLYISLGGNRKGSIRTNINLMITMLLGGLWHGANWNFVLWGFLHGIALIINKMFNRYCVIKTTKISKLISWLFTYIFICYCWVFFRAQDFNTAIIIIQKSFFINSIGISWFYTPLLIIIILITVVHTFNLYSKRKDYYLDLTSFVGAFILIFTLMGIFFLSPTNSSPFIYFQF